MWRCLYNAKSSVQNPSTKPFPPKEEPPRKQNQNNKTHHYNRRTPPSPSLRTRRTSGRIRNILSDIIPMLARLRPALAAAG